MVRTLTRWTVADYHRMIAEGLLAGRQVELVDGQIVDMAPELPIHRATYRRGVKYLESVLKERAVLFSAAPITLPTDGEPESDISILMPPEANYDYRHPGPDDIYWLIEVSNSTLAYDLEKKAQIYALDRIQEYWVIDVQGKAALGSSRAVWRSISFSQTGQIWKTLSTRDGRYLSPSRKVSTAIR